MIQLVGWDRGDMSRFELLSDAQWLLIEGFLQRPTGRRGRRLSDARRMVVGIGYRYRTGIAWRESSPVFGPWQTVWAWHHRMAVDGTWDRVLDRLTAKADRAGAIDWSPSVGSTIARASAPTGTKSSSRRRRQHGPPSRPPMGPIDVSLD